jgi:hypothetical protein
MHREANLEDLVRQLAELASASKSFKLVPLVPFFGYFFGHAKK